MTKQIKNFVKGIGSVANLYPQRTRMSSQSLEQRMQAPWNRVKKAFELALVDYGNEQKSDEKSDK